MNIQKGWTEFLASIEKITDSDKPLRELGTKAAYFFVLQIGRASCRERV